MGAGVAGLAALGTAFTSQGFLRLNGAPVTGTCDFTFGLFGSASGGSAPGTASASGVAVSQGLHQMVQEQAATIAAQQAELAAQEGRIEALEREAAERTEREQALAARLAALEARLAGQEAEAPER